MPRPTRQLGHESIGDRITDRLFFAHDGEALAKALLGRVLVRALDGRLTAGVIVETEAYLGEPDAASHAYKGRRTARTEPMFAQPGTSYVYFTYGMHFCFNVVGGEVGVPHAVLVRALRPIAGIDAMRARRFGARAPMPDRELCSGPAKLCQALAIGRSLNAIDLTSSNELWIAEPAEGPSVLPGKRAITRGPRIGVAYAGDWADKPLRFWISGDENVSVRSGRVNVRNRQKSP